MDDLAVNIALRTPAHGHGRLQVGNPGNRGGPGRPRKVVQAASRALYDTVLAKLAAKLEQELDVPELVSVGAMAGRYAGLAATDAEDNAPMLGAEARKARVMAILMQVSPADRARLLSGTGLPDPTLEVQPEP